MCLTVTVYMQGLFSNSFIIAEETVVFYFVQSMVVAFGVSIAREPTRYVRDHSGLVSAGINFSTEGKGGKGGGEWVKPTV